MAGQSERQQLQDPDVIPTDAPDKKSSTSSVQKSLSNKDKPRPVSVSANDPLTAAEVEDRGTLPKVYSSVRTALSRNVVMFLGVQRISELCDPLQLHLERQEGSDTFTVGGDLPGLQTFQKDVLNNLKTNSNALAYGFMFSENSVEERSPLELTSTCESPEESDVDSETSQDALETPSVEQNENAQAEPQTLPQTPGSYQMLSHPFPSRLVSSNRAGREALMSSAEVFLETQTQLSKQAVLLLGVLPISQICERLRLKLFAHQGLSSFVVVGLYEDLQLLHQHICQLSVNSTTYACVYGTQEAARHTLGMAPPALVGNQNQMEAADSQPSSSQPSASQPLSSQPLCSQPPASQPPASQPPASQPSATGSGSLQEGKADSEGDVRAGESSKVFPSDPLRPSMRKSETFQLNKLTVDLVQVIAKEKLKRIEQDCHVKIRKESSPSSAEALLSVEGTSKECDLSRGLELLKQECLDVSRQGIEEAKIKLEANSNVAAIKAMTFEEMRVIGAVEDRKCTIYGLRKDVEAAEKKIKKVLERPGLFLSGGSSGTFTLQSGQTVIVKKGNIVHENVDVIVNAANERLEHSAGVAGAICRAAGGWSFQDECHKLVRRKGSVREGEAVYTGAGLLPFKMIVHTVAPRWSTFKSEQSQRVLLLKKACYNSLYLTDEKGGTSVAIPGLGSGIYGIPKPVCAQALLDGTEEFFKKKRSSAIRRVVFIDLDDSAVAAFMAEAGKRYGQGASQERRDREKQDQKQKEQGSGFLSQISRVGSWFSGRGSGERESTEGNASEKEGAEPCSVCFDQKVDMKLKCGHEFCKACIDQWAKVKATCPVCNSPFGKIKGNQPVGARMDVNLLRQSLPGYERYGTIVISYHIPSGVQGDEHPHPGQRFTGTSRTGYLPNNREGNELLSLLRKAFEARLVFTVGRSVTSGQNNVVTWNDIHHKTNISGGAQGYGYPDPTYLARLRADLKVKGIE